MQNGYYFFSVFVGTIIAIRILLSSKRVHSPTIYGIHLHHYMYGAVLIILSLTTSNLTLYAIGLGLLVDELPQVVTGAWRWEDYYSAKYGLGMVALIVVIYLLRDHLVPIS